MQQVVTRNKENQIEKDNLFESFWCVLMVQHINKTGFRQVSLSPSSVYLKNNT